MMNAADMRSPKDFKARPLRAAAEERRAMQTLKRIRAGDAFVIAEHLLVADAASREETAFLELRWTGDKWAAKPRELSFALIAACASEGVLHFPFDNDRRGVRSWVVSDIKDRDADRQAPSG